MENFYTRLASFSNFSEVANAGHYHPVPEDWSIFISDVRDSTKAIQAGQYKEVNLVGAASIVVSRNAMESLDFPFVFGGDGATLLIPPEKTERVTLELSKLKALAKKNFGFDLRVGRVPVKQIYFENKQLEVAKFELTPGRSIAMMRGSGLELAEDWIKRSGEKFEVSVPSEQENDLSGLSCRWQPIPSKNGKIISLIVYARGESPVFPQLFEGLDEIFPEGFESLNPAKIHGSRYKSVFSCLIGERKFHRNLWSNSFLKRVREIFISVGLFKYKLPFSFVPPYLEAISSHSDFRKFDNMLRMVIDCKPSQIKSLKAFLEKLHQQDSIFYGLFESEKSLMTCFVENLSQGGHIHFMDAENGGYAMAALALKQQMELDRK
jgi:hypothetical protein